MKNKKLKILLAAPRGFCAGVDRAIEIVKKSINKFGAPVYVRHEIVHNKYVVDNLKKIGAIFVEKLEEVKDKTRPVIFSAHGVPKSVPEKAKNLNMEYIDATCPLVTKVHKEAENLYKNNYHILLIGHLNHPEVIGTMGQLPKGSIDLIETVEDVNNYVKKNDKNFINDFKYFLKNYVGRPSPLFFAERITNDLKGPKIYFKRDELNHTGAHKINNCVGQILLAKKMGKQRIIAETGAGQHGVATATV